jgi:CBS domain-containing protein
MPKNSVQPCSSRSLAGGTSRRRSPQLFFDTSLEETRMRTLTAGDVMNAGVKTVRVDLTASELAAFLAENQISGAPVVDQDGRMVGVVSLMDLAENEATRRVARDEGPEFYLHGWEDKMDPGEVRRLRVVDEDLLVGDIMTPTVYTVPAETSVSEVARTMLAGRVHRLLVTREGRVVGIVTTMDLLKLLGRGES